MEEKITDSVDTIILKNKDKFRKRAGGITEYIERIYGL